MEVGRMIAVLIFFHVFLNFLDEYFLFLLDLVARSCVHDGEMLVRSVLCSLVLLRHIVALVTRHVPAYEHRHAHQCDEEHGQNGTCNEQVRDCGHNY